MVKRILVTGGAGFIGHHLVGRLSEGGNYQIAVIDDLSNSNKNFDAKKFGNNVTFYKEDIRNREAVNDIVKHERVDSCIHLAAKISAEKSFYDPLETVDVNVNGTLCVLDACARNGVKSFIFASSAAVYGNSPTLPIPEDAPLQPISPYGASKVAGEAFVSSYGASHTIEKTISLRFFNVYGEGQSAAYAGVITKFAEQISQGVPPVIFGSGEQTRDFVSVNDVLNALTLALKSAGVAPAVYNIATGRSLSLNELARMMIKQFGQEGLEPVYSSPQEGDIMHSCGDVRKARKDLSFEPSDSFELTDVLTNLVKA